MVWKKSDADADARVSRISLLLYKYNSHYYIEDICLFQCKNEIYSTEWTPGAIFSRATCENIKAGVHKWNIISSYM